MVWTQLEDGFPQLEPIALVGNRLSLGEKANDNAQSLVHLFPLGSGVDAHHVGVSRQRARTNSKQHPAPGHVVKLDHAVGHHEGMMIRQADNPGAQFDLLRPLRRRSDEHLRRRDDLPPGAVVLADPGFVIAQLVQPLDQLNVPSDGQGGIFANPVEGPQKDSKLHSFWQRHFGSLSNNLLIVVSSNSDRR